MSRIYALALLPLASAAFAQGDPSMIEKIVKEGRDKSKTYTILNELCDTFGPRLTGSPQLYKAQEWAVKKFKSYGLTNVHMEQWGEVPVGFYRGSRQVVKMTKPWKSDFVFTTPAWTPGTKGKIKITPILQPQTMEEFEAVKDKLPGSWMVMTRSAGLRGPSGNASEVEKAMADIKLAGRIYGAPDERVHTGGRFTGLTMETLPEAADVRIRKSDYTTLVTALKAKRDTELELDIENHFVKGPVPQYNVIAELKGSEKPDEIVIICGHFDSWDGPGSKGANDNGTGSSVTIEAARILTQAGAKPKRTIRFILWSGEEQGLLGSRAYVEKHKDEMPKISAVFNDDGGTNYQGGYICIENMKDMLETAVAPSRTAFPELPIEIRVQKEFAVSGSSDHAPFAWAGVPGFFTIEAGKADYGFVWHTQNDRPENSISEYLTQSSTNAALVAFNIAAADQLMPRVPARSTGTQGRPAGGTRIYHDPSEHRHDDDHDHEDEYIDYVIDSLLRWATGK